MVEFPSYAAALACYRSDRYQAAIALRRPVAVGEFLIIEGYDGPQPEATAAAAPISGVAGLGALSSLKYWINVPGSGPS